MSQRGRWKSKTDSVEPGQTDGSKKVAICKLKLPGTGWVPVISQVFCCTALIPNGY
ncbi:hypothetical protein PTI98_005828 [Pleurotus ostreatus]|nr:hypothetical protein PTI98_005828 [Pleurotus ostreatus]